VRNKVARPAAASTRAGRLPARRHHHQLPPASGRRPTAPARSRSRRRRRVAGARCHLPPPRGFPVLGARTRTRPLCPARQRHLRRLVGTRHHLPQRVVPVLGARSRRRLGVLVGARARLPPPSVPHLAKHSDSSNPVSALNSRLRKNRKPTATLLCRVWQFRRYVTSRLAARARLNAACRTRTEDTGCVLRMTSRWGIHWLS